MPVVSCQIDRDIEPRALLPDPAHPWNHLAEDQSVILVNDTPDRFEHLLFQGERLRPALYLPSWEDPKPQDSTEIAERLFAELRATGYRLRYVLKRAILNRDPNHAYVFLRENDVMVVPVESCRVVPSGSAMHLTAFHTPASRPHPGGAAPEPPCHQCGELHLRTLITYFMVEATKKSLFIQGLATNHLGESFDPVQHCEWFNSLPSAWKVAVNGGSVILHRPDGSVRWIDDRIQLSTTECRVSDLSVDHQSDLALSYQRASADGSV